MSREIGARIKEVRKSAGMSQEEFGRNIGISKPSVSLLESGKNNPSDQTIKFICGRYCVNRKWLLTGEGEMKSAGGREQAIAWVNYVFDNEPDSVKRRFLEFLVNASDSQLDAVETAIKVFSKYLDQ